jgi:large subunit ribosomal protein L4
MTTKKAAIEKKTRSGRAAKRAVISSAVKSAGKAKGPVETSLPVYDLNGKEVERFQLDKEIFDGKVHKSALYHALRMYNANKRAGTASTKTRGDVSGGGKKPWRQKGTGRARSGSSRSPLWRHGGIIFGPHPRDFHYDIPKKVKRLALLSSLNSKLTDNKWIGVSAVDIKEPKTKKFQAVIDALKLKGKSLFIVEDINENLRRSSRNIEGVSVKHYKDFNTLDVLTCDTLVMSKTALGKLPERLKV